MKDKIENCPIEIANDIWNAAIQRCMDLLNANRKISDYDKENLSYAMRREKKMIVEDYKQEHLKSVA